MTIARRTTINNFIWRLVAGRRGQERRAKRVAYRHAGMTVLSLAAWPWLGYWPLWTYVATVLSIMTARTWTAVRTWRFRRHVLSPVTAVIDPVIRSRSPSGQGLVHLDIPRDFRDRSDTAIHVHLPMDWTPDASDMTKLTRLLSQRLNMSELTAAWTLTGRKPYVTYALPAKPPERVTFTDMVDFADDAADGTVIMGQGPNGQLVIFDLAMESPHLLAAAGSGAGKSELAAWLAGQFMRRGFGIIVLDAKFVSHMWLRRVPGVLYAAESEELHEALLWLDEELLSRARFVSAGGDPAVLVPLFVLAEEMNGATNRLRGYWKNELGGKGMSPALTALANLANMGREMRVHIMMVGQSMTAKATGGPEGRESFGARALARATSNQWRMLAPQIKPIPAGHSAPGRWHLVVGNLLREYQAPFCDIKNQEARLIGWATGNGPVPDVPAMMLGGGGGSENAQVRRSKPPTPTGISIRDWLETHPEIELATMLRWRERRDDFPAPVGEGARGVKLYDPADLDLFVLSRTR